MLNIYLFIYIYTNIENFVYMVFNYFHIFPQIIQPSGKMILESRM